MEVQFKTGHPQADCKVQKIEGHIEKTKAELKYSGFLLYSAAHGFSVCLFCIFKVFLEYTKSMKKEGDIMMLVMKRRTAALTVLGVLAAAALTGAACRLCIGEKTFLPGEGRVLVIDAGHAAKR